MLRVTLENGELFVQENDEPKQKLLSEGPQDFYSATSSDEFSFSPPGGSTANVMILHLDDGRELSLKRLE
jgi:hypothetical protein